MEEHFENSDSSEFIWQTGHFYIGREEDELLKPLHEHLSGRKFLEIGSGQGANCKRISAFGPSISIGVEPSWPRSRFASRNVKSSRYVCALGEALPFADQSIDVVLLRDVLHHVETPDRLLKEMARVLRRGGTFYILEPNGRNPILWIWSRLTSFDRGISQNTLSTLLDRIHRGDLMVHQTYFFQPMPFSRVIYHHRLSPFTHWRSLAPFVRWIEKLFSTASKTSWAYFGFLGTRKTK